MRRQRKVRRVFHCLHTVYHGDHLHVDRHHSCVSVLHGFDTLLAPRHWSVEDRTTCRDAIPLGRDVAAGRTVLSRRLGRPGLVIALLRVYVDIWIS